jgi:hypothetical protein
VAQDCAQRDDDAAQQRRLAGTRPEDFPAQPTDGVLVDLAQFGLITQCVADASQPPWVSLERGLASRYDLSASPSV